MLCEKTTELHELVTRFAEVQAAGRAPVQCDDEKCLGCELGWGGAHRSKRLPRGTPVPMAEPTLPGSRRARETSRLDAAAAPEWEDSAVL